MRREVDLPRQVSAPARARRLVSRLVGSALSKDELETSTLVVSELVSNAVQHGNGQIRLLVELDDDRLRVEVIDQGTGFAHQLGKVPFHQARGRGLMIVDTVTSRWGIYEGTTHVWAEIEREGPRLAPPIPES